MRNKPYISFFVNLLIGILFSFPVFSTQGSVDHGPVTVPQYSMADDCAAGIMSFTDDKAGLTIQKVKYSRTPQNKCFDKHYFPGDKHNSSFDPNYQWHNELSTRIIASDHKYRSSVFVNISYLKDLRTTKMLC